MLRSEEDGDEIGWGALDCAACTRSFPIRDGLPRFVPESGYADSFALEWKTYCRTQYDSQTGRTLPRDRFFRSTGFPEDLRGETMLEAGCGSGRFTEIARATGARLFSFDFSRAVEAAAEGNRPALNVSFAQADALEPPFAPRSFDRVFCLGVLQHTPDPERAFLALAALLKPGGSLAIDVYDKNWKNAVSPRRQIQRLTRRVEPVKLLRLIQRSWPWLVSAKRAVQTIPWLGHRLDDVLFPVVDYREALPLSPEQNAEWSTLDTFDIYSARYELRQSQRDVQRWFERAGLEEIEIGPGHNGIVARGRAAAAVRAPAPATGGRATPPPT